MEQRSNLKNYLWLLVVMLVVNIFICAYASGSLSRIYSIGVTAETVKMGSLVGGALMLVVFVLNGILTPNLKAILVFKKTKNYYPGCHAFSEHMNSDVRVDTSKLIERYGELPTDPIAQNRLWYSIFKKHENKPRVVNAHKNFLLCRDMTALSAIIAVVFPMVGMLLRIQQGALLYYIGFLLFQYSIVSMAAKNYGIRFVCNVLAEESHQ